MFFPFEMKYTKSVSTSKNSESILALINNTLINERHINSKQKVIIERNILIFLNRLMTYDPFFAIEKGEFTLMPSVSSTRLTYKFFMYRCLLIYIFGGTGLIAIFSKSENRTTL